MRPFQIVGKPVQVGTGEQLVLQPDQLAARKHAVRVIKTMAKDATLVEALQVLTFKSGEIIGLKEIPKHARDHVIDLRADDDAKREAARAAAVEQARVRDAAAAEQAKLRAREKFVTEAGKAYAASEDLRTQFPTVEAYIASLDAAK
ncbi:hypothetical protein ACSHT2_02710 [Bradyrhizobium sp. PUT101]|uniref:hypothetical protein n=1 Tax=Bradyrhizobium sp. PUT101 TaxID=3447427 RepID=UPI003F85E9EF